MSIPPIEIEPDQLLLELTKNINKVRENHNGLITIICPTNTTSVFLKKQYEHHVRNSVGIRFSTVDEALSLLEDAFLENSISMKTNTVGFFDTSVSIAMQLFPNSSPWIKAPLVQSTLEILYAMDEKFQEQALNDYEIVSKCFETFRNLENPISKTSQNEIQMSADHQKTFGKFIIFGFEKCNRDMDLFIRKYSNFVDSIVLTRTNQFHKEIEIFKTPHEELDNIIEDFSSRKPIDVINCALIIPDNKYKRLAVSIARRKGIPLVGSSPENISTHPFFNLSRYLLSQSNSKINIEIIEQFKERFPWIKDYKNKISFIDCLDLIEESKTIGEYFTHISNFINSEINIEFFLSEEFDFAPSEDKNQLAFSIINELCSSTSSLSKYEATLLLDSFAKNYPERLGSLGEGLYVGTPSELFGSFFNEAYICGMNERYIAPKKISSSFIPRDQYETYGINGKIDSENNAQLTLRWLRSCASSITMTSSVHGIERKSIIQPYWSTKFETEKNSSLLSDFNWNETIYEPATYLQNLISSDLNNVNGLVDTPLNPAYSVTGIEKLARCPAKYFLTEILHARSPATSDNPDELLPQLIGNYIHNHLEDFVKDSLNEEDLLELISANVNELRKSNQLPNNASSILAIEKLQTIARNFLKLHQKSRATKIEVETKTDKTIDIKGEKISFRGKIDRIQTDDQNKVTLVDYKTGKYHASKAPFRLGQKLQLAIYALLQDQEPDSIEYWHLTEEKNPVDAIAWTKENRVLAEETIAGLNDLLSHGVFIPREEIVELTSNSPKHKSECGNCEMENFCYQEHRELFAYHDTDERLSLYRKVTGEELFDSEALS